MDNAFDEVRAAVQQAQEQINDAALGVTACAPDKPEGGA